MARMGGKKQLKRLAAPRSWKIKRKVGGRWITNVMPGPHPKERSIPLRVLIRDILGLCDNAREADYVIKKGYVLVDGKPRKEPKYPVGLFDVVEIPLIEKAFRIVLDEHGRIVPKEIEKDEKKYKLCRIEKKVTVKGGKIQIGTHDGRSFLVGNEYKVGDVLKIEVPSQKIVDHYPLEEGSEVYILSGKHAGTTGVIEKIIPGDMIREKMVRIKVEDTEIETAARNVFVLGKGGKR